MTAETDKAALRERHDEVTVEMIAAAWEVVRDRYPNGRVLGPGPGFREAIEAALALRPLCDLEARIVEVETEAEVDREFAETSRQQAIAAEARADRLAAEMETLRAQLSASDAARESAAEERRVVQVLSSLDGKNAWDALLMSKVDWGVVRQLWHKKIIAGDKNSLGHCSDLYLTEAGQSLARAADKPGERTDSPDPAPEGQPR